MMLRFLITCLWLSAAAIPEGEGCVIVDASRDRITAADLAAAVPGFATLPPELTVGYAPAPGVRRVFRVAELGRLRSRFGLPAGILSEICVERPLRRLNEAEMRAAMLAGLAQDRLYDGARLEILDFSRHPAPLGELVFPVRGLGTPPARQPDGGVLWKGHVRYSGARRFNVWAKVRIRVPRDRVVAKTALRAGKPIERGEVAVEHVESFPAPNESASRVEQVAGRTPRRTIPAGAGIPLSLLAEAPVIARGDPVRVEVREGNASLSLTARAEAPGRRGEAVLLRNPSNGRRFRARVEGKGVAAIEGGTPEQRGNE